MVTKQKTARKRPAPKKPDDMKPRELDENTAAHVIAEYLAIEKIKTEELDPICGDDGTPGSRKLSYRGVALTFRVSEILGIDDAFVMPPKFRLAFERAREWVKMMEAATAAAEAEAVAS